MLYPISKNHYLSKPRQGPDLEIIINNSNPNREGYHICDREDCSDNETEILTMGRIHWCYTRAIYWCEYCKQPINFNLAWCLRVNTPEDLDNVVEV